MAHEPSTQLKSPVPLLSALSRAEELCAALTMRLDPITQHVPLKEDASANPMPMTVTRRLDHLGDTLQYLLDNIEL